MNPGGSLTNLYLVGFRCTGKTSVGRLLAGLLGREFVDMDRELAARGKKTIQQMVEDEGWQCFRKRESQLLDRLSRSSEQVIATGGGAVTMPGNIALMRSTGKVVWLRARPSTIVERMTADSHTAGQRPPLKGEDSLTEIKEVLEERLPLYRQAMDFCVDTDTHSPEEAARRILAWLQCRG
ncbi:MAG: shikimate kinase [Syntrophobacteria bacterium]